jgi:hypothetical protein
MSICIAALLTFVTTFSGRLSQQIFQISNSNLFNSGIATGSLSGGSILYVKGVGFDPMGGTNKVFVGTFPCNIIDYFATDTFIACQMPAENHGTVDLTLTVTVYIMGVPYTCQTATNCQVKLLFDKSPNLKAIVPQSVVAGQNVTLVGYFVSSSSDGIKEVKIGDFHCSVSREDPTSMSSSNRYASFTCLVPDNIISNDYAMTVSAAQGTGFATSFVSALGFKVGFSQTKFNIRVHPTLDQISSNKGFVDGQILTLSGKGFGTNSSIVNIKYKNMKCNVIEITNTQLKCELEADPGTSTSVNFIGGAGLEQRLYSLNLSPSSLVGRTNYPNNDSPKISITLTTENLLNLNNYSQRMLGLFYAPVSGTYTFYLSSDDQSSLRMSSSAFDPTVPFDESQLTEICYIASFTQFRSFYQYSSQICTINLEASKYYYILAMHSEGGGADHISIGVNIPNSDSSLPNTKSAVKKLYIQNTPVREIISFKIYNATGGTYKIRFYEKNQLNQVTIDSTTGDITFNATLSSVVNSIRSATNYNVAGVRVGIDNLGQETADSLLIKGYLYTLTFNSYRSTQPLPFLLTQNITGTAQWSTERLTSASPPVSGTFKIQVGDQISSSISTYISAGDLQNILIKMPMFSNGVTVSEVGDNYDGKSWFVRLDSLKTNPDFTIVENLVAGGSVSTPAVLIIDNSFVLPSNDLYYMPIPSDLLYTFSSNPEIRVKIGDYHASCRNSNCNYSVAAIDKSPVIESFSITGQSLSINLASGYDTKEDSALIIVANISIRFSKSKCTISSFSLPVIVCTLPTNADSTLNIAAGSIIPKVHLENRGYFAVTASAMTVNLVLTSVTPSSGSLGGNTPIVIVGQGFSSETVVTINNKPCKITSINNIEIFCNTPSKGSGNAAATIIITEGIVTQTSSSLYTYDSALTPTITALSPNSASPVLKSDLVISASNIGLNSSDLEVSLIGAKADNTPIILPCTVNSVDATGLTCRLGGGPSGTYRVLITRKNIGDSLSDPVDANIFKYTITVTSINYTSGSKAGGQIITITGTNFSSILNQNQVLIDKTFCKVVFASPTQIKAIIPAIPNANSLVYPIYVIGRVVEEAICNTSVCQYTYSDSYSPTITSMTPVSGVIGTSVTVTGTLLSGNGVIIKLGDLVISTITDHTQTSITFVIPNVTSFKNKLNVFIPEYGDALINPDIFFENLFSVTDITPKTGSRWGNYIIITGNGFDYAGITTVKIGSNFCSVTQISTTSITCWFENLAAFSTSYNVVVYQQSTSKTCPNCSYLTDSSSTTPKITTISSNSFSTPEAFTFIVSGTLLGDGTNTVVQLISRNDTTRKIDGAINVVNNVINLAFATVPVGNYKLVYSIISIGFAQISATTADISVDFGSSDFVSSVAQISYAGGYIYTLSGKGFVDKADLKETAISICGNIAQITSSTFNSLSFVVPPFVSTASNQILQLSTNLKVLPKMITSLDNPTTVNNVNDSNYNTYFSSSSNSCFINYDFGDKLKAQVNKIDLFPYPGVLPSTLAGALIQGSNDNTTWTTLITIPTDVVSNWNSYFPPTDLPASWLYRYIRFSGNFCKITEFQVYGILLNEGGDGTSDFCNIDISMRTKSISLSNKVEYRGDKTPYVTSINPALGATSGGTVVIIQGNGFNPSTTTVEIDKIACVINQPESSATSLKCTTGARSTFIPPTLKISTISGLASNKGNSYLYIDRWSDSQTWGGESFPREGDSVYVPIGQNLLIDITPPRIYSLIVEGSIIWADETDSEFKASFIVIRGGQLKIGSKESPYTKKLKITLFGNKDDKQLPMVGNKHISVHGGQIDIHGMPKTPTWTLLGASVQKGSSTITLTEAVNWLVGDEIVVASTSFNRDEFERRFIVTISSDGKTLTLDSPLLYAHFGETLNYNSQNYEVRAEVAVLTRNVRVFGDDSTIDTQYGAHIMMMGRDIGLRGRISYLEMDKCGQAFQMGRYPIHFHMAGNVIGSYIEGCSVHDSFNRGTTIHGVHFLTIKNNVYLNHMGHGIFIEDSVETNNIIEGNLIMRTTTSASLLFSDLKPAAIWITMPKNFIRYNHAAGSTHFGFWFDLPGNPTGPSATATVCPSGTPLGQFHHNVAHTNGIGLRIYPIYIPRTNPCGGVSNSSLQDPFSENPSVIAEFTDNLLFVNGQGFFGRNLGAIQIKRTAFISNGMNAAVAEPNSAILFTPRIEDSIFVGKVNSWYSLQGVQSSGAFGTGRRDGFLLKNIKFYDFPSSATMFNTCDGCGNELHRDIGARQTRFEQLEFLNVQAKMIQYDDASRDKDILQDVDGSLIKKFGISSSTGGWIVPYFKHLEAPGCITVITDTTLCSEKCLICDNTIKLRRLTFVMSGSNFDGLDLKILNYSVTDTMNNPDNFSIVKFRSVTIQNFKGWAIPFVSSFSYNIHWSTGLDFNSLFIENSLLHEANDAGFYLRTNNTYQRELYEGKFTGIDSGVYKSKANITALAIAPTSANLFGDFYYTNLTNTSLIRMDGRKIGQLNYTGIICRNYCPVDPGTTPLETQIRLWSNHSSWNSGTIPITGDLVTIEAGWNMLLDIDTPLLAKLTITGKLAFSLTQPSLLLRTKNIDITQSGILEIGNSTNAFSGNAKISLEGDRTDPQIIIDPVITPVVKGIAVKGQFIAYGLQKNPIIARLSQNALINANIITVNQVTNWAVGDQLVIAASSRKPNDVDYVTIIEKISTTSFKVNPPFVYNHYGSVQPIITNGKRNLDMRAEVAVLTRNIVIEGDYSSNWGCRILVAGYDNIMTTPTQIIRGMIDLNYIEIKNGGQKDTEQASIDFQGAVTKLQRVVGCSIRSGIGWGMNIAHSNNIYIDNNVFTNQTKIGVHLIDSQSVLFQNNAIIKINNRTDYSNIEFFDLIYGFYYNDPRYLKENNVTIKHNIISSSQWFAWAVPGYDCSEDVSLFFNNTGHSSRAGWFGMKTSKKCMKYSDFTGYLNFDEGFAQRYEMTNLVVTRMLFADNNNSISINGGDPQDSMYPTSVFYDSEIIGHALKDCPFCYQTVESCQTSGLYTSLFETSSFLLNFEENRLPLHNTTTTEFLWGGIQTINNVNFSDFTSTSVCRKNYPIRANNFIQDTSVFVNLTNVYFSNVDYSNTIFFFNHTRTKNPGFCSKRDCTGIYNLIISDTSGTIFGKKMTFFGFNKPAGRDGNCTFESNWNGHVCNPVFALLSIQQPAQDRPVVITRTYSFFVSR